MTTHTIYADDINSGAGPYGLKSRGAWADALAGTGFQLVTETGSTFDVEIQTGGSDTIRATHWTFDTSVIADTDTIDSATLNAYYGATGTDDGIYKALIADTYNGGAVVTGDWEADYSDNTYVASIDPSGLTHSARNDFTSESAFTSNINVTGDTFIVVVHENVVSRTEADVSSVQEFSVPASDTTEDPRLTVVSSSAGIPVQTNHYLRMMGS